MVEHLKFPKDMLTLLVFLRFGEWEKLHVQLGSFGIHGAREVSLF